MRGHDAPSERRVTGPHPPCEAATSQVTGQFWRCEVCKTEAETPRLKERCWSCDGSWVLRH
jgi:hypothetical protein